MEYASISEVWGDSFCKKDKPNKGKLNPVKMYDNIIDSYIDDFDKSKNIKIKRQKTKLETDVQPFSSEKTFMDYDAYFSKTNLFPQDNSDIITNDFYGENTIPERDENDIKNEYSIDNNIVVEEETNEIETYVNNKNAHEEQSYVNYDFDKQRNYKILDLILYIISGVFLIFMLEQVLKIGTIINSTQTYR